MTNLKDKIVLITGAGGGFGREMTMQFSAAGCRLFVTDVNDKSVERAAGLAGSSLLGSVVADLGTEQGSTIIEHSCAQMKIIPDVIINNAGVAVTGRLDHVPRNKWELLMQLNLLSPMRLCNLWIPDFIARGHGHFVNISSLAGWIGVDGLSAYCASKFGLRGFGESLAADLEGTGVKVTNVYPSFSQTAILDSEQFGYETPRIVPQRLISDPADVVRNIIEGVQKNQLSVFPDKHARRVHYIKRFAPWLIPMVIRVEGAD